MEKDKDKKFCDNKHCGSKMYPGVSTDIADNEKVTAEEVKEDVSMLNNNPRNDAE